MKAAVTRMTNAALEHCPSCGLTGTAALLGEQQAAVARQSWRHSVCGHVLMFRPGKPLARVGLPSVRTQISAMY